MLKYATNSPYIHPCNYEVPSASVFHECLNFKYAWVTVTHSRIENSMKLPSQNVLAVLLLQTCMVLLLRSQKVICRREKERVILDRKSGSLYRFRQQYILLVSNINPSSFVNVTLCNILIRASDLLRQYMRCSDITEPPR